MADTVENCRDHTSTSHVHGLVTTLFDSSGRSDDICRGQHPFIRQRPVICRVGDFGKAIEHRYRIEKGNLRSVHAADQRYHRGAELYCGIVSARNAASPLTWVL